MHIAERSGYGFLVLYEARRRTIPVPSAHFLCSSMRFLSRVGRTTALEARTQHRLSTRPGREFADYLAIVAKLVHRRGSSANVPPHRVHRSHHLALTRASPELTFGCNGIANSGLESTADSRYFQISWMEVKRREGRRTLVKSHPHQIADEAKEYATVSQSYLRHLHRAIARRP
jgi:hypothetical protein